MLSKLFRNRPLAINTHIFTSRTIAFRTLTNRPARFMANQSTENMFTFEDANNESSNELNKSVSKDLRNFINMFKSNKQIQNNMIKEINRLCDARDQIEHMKKDIKFLSEINEKNEHKMEEIEKLIANQETEFISIVKRLETEIEKTKLYSLTPVAKDWLEVVDNIDRSIVNLKSEAFAKAKGRDEIVKLLEELQTETKNSLEKFGITKMEVEIGQKVDPNFHHIIACIPMSGKQNDEILDVTQVGYHLKDRVLRPAKVVVIKN